MDRRQRMTMLGIAAAIAVVAVVIAVASGGGDEGETTSANQVTETRSGDQGGTEGEAPDSRPAAEEPEPKPEVIKIRLKDGEPVGGTEETKLQKGEPGRIDVVSDTADEAHLHGYDITKQLEPGKTAKFRFRADLEGVFEIELHDSPAQVARLTVEP